MTEEIKPNPEQATTHEAQLAAESMVEGQEKVPAIDVSADYEASKAFSVSEIDRTEEGAPAAAAATAPKFEVPAAKETEFFAEPTGDPADYMDMAKEVSRTPVASGEVTDELVQKALEMGQPAS
jgi:hypothetical protein